MIQVTLLVCLVVAAASFPSEDRYKPDRFRPSTELKQQYRYEDRQQAERKPEKSSITYAGGEESYANQAYGPLVSPATVGPAPKNSRYVEDTGTDRDERTSDLLDSRPNQYREIIRSNVARSNTPTLDTRPKPFQYGYEIEDDQGNVNFRKEDSDGGQSGVRGVYGFRAPDGQLRVVEYIANTDGFRAVIRTNEPGTADQDPADAAVYTQGPARPGYKPLTGRVVPGDYLNRDYDQDRSKDRGHY